MKYAILGSNGNVGSSILREFKRYGIECLQIERETISDQSMVSLFEWCNENKPDYFINCIAYMSVDLCELNPELSEQTNAKFVDTLARFIQTSTESRLIHLSSDFVFGGHDKSTPYLPNDSTSPVNIYGHHKVLGENSVLSILGSRARVVRLSSFVGNSDKKMTFLDKIQKQSLASKELRVVDDLIISITTDRVLCQSVLDAFDSDDLIQHAACHGQTSWFDLAKEFVNLSGLDIDVVPIKTRSLNLPAVRPKYSVLNPTSYSGKVSVSWQESLNDVYKGLRYPRTEEF
jgi:dTDP-4-dehydrorhamnose reductase